MACQIQTDKYTDVVLDLIKLDQTLYNNFDNAAIFVLESSLSPEQKMMALHNMAHIYSRLIDFDADFYNKGRAADVINASGIEDPQEYVNTVAEFYGVTKSPELKVQNIYKKIDEIENKKNVNRVDLHGPDGVLSLIKNYFTVTAFADLEQRKQVLNDIATALRTAISERRDEINHKEFLLAQVDSTIASLDKDSVFIPITEIAGMAGLNNVLVTLKSGQMVEAISENDKFYTTDAEGVMTEIPADQVVVAKDSRLSDRSKSNAGKHVFYDDAMLSNFRVKAVNPEEEAAIMAKLDSMPSPMAGIRVHAVKISDIGDRRVERIKAVADTNSALAPLAKREHETFENATQIAYLQSGAHNKILTLSRPKASEQSFVLVGEIIGTGERFYLYSNENFAFVNSDNSTERVDFTNPAHLAEVAKTAEKGTFNGNVPLTEEDLKNFSDATKEYADFKESISEELDAKFAAGQSSVDITDQFFNMYEANQSRHVKNWTSLSSNVENDPRLAVMLTVFNENTGTREERKIPFMLYSIGNKDVRPWNVVNLLKQGEYIELTDNTGTVRQLSMQDYVNKVLRLDTAAINKLLTGKDQAQRNIVLMFKGDGTISYRIYRTERQLDQMEEFVGFITTLMRELPTKNMFDFDKKQYTFIQATAADGKSRPLFVSFSADFRGNLQLRFKPASDKYSFMKDVDPLTKKDKNAKQFAFTVPKEVLNNLVEEMKSESKLITEIKKEIPALAQYTISKPDEMYAFYRAVNNLTKGGTAHPLLQQLADHVASMNDKFARALIDNVINKLEEKTAMFPQFMEALREDFTYDGEFRPYYLVAQDNPNGTFTAKVKYSKEYEAPKGMENARDRFQTNYDNYSLLNSSNTRFTITPRSAKSLQPNTTDIKLEASPALEVATAAHVINPKQEAPRPADELPDIELFSIGTPGVETETSAERLTAAQWLKTRLPQASISTALISEVIDLTKIDGTVLGATKDMVIYLNEQLKSKGVIYHEAFHIVFRRLLDKEVRDLLISEVKANKKNTGLFTEASLKEFARVRNYVYSKERMEALRAEEILADGFQTYMNGKSKPKGLIEAFMQLLRQLLNFFVKNQSEIEALYGKINAGGFSAVAPNDGRFDTEFAFEVIPGLTEIVPENNEFGAAKKPTVLSPAEQNQLVGMMTQYFLHADNRKGETFEQKFDRLAKHVLEHEYNLDKMYATHPKELHAQIDKDYKNLIKQYRFALGARMLGEELPEINNSGKETFDKVTYKKTFEGEDNTLGQVSKKKLMELVKKNYAAVQNILDGVDTPEGSVDKKVLTDTFDEEGNKVVVNPDDETGGNDQETTEDSVDFDKGLNEHSRLESLNKELRRFFSLIKYERKDANGISFPKLLNGSQIFNTLLQTTADIDVEHLIPHILRTSEKLREDGYTEAADDLKAVYDAIDNRTLMSKNGGVPMRDLRFYNMLVDVLDGTEIDYLMTDAKTNEIVDDENRVIGVSTSSTRIYDQVMTEDIRKRKRDIISNIITTHAAKATSEEYKAAAKQLIVEAKRLGTSEASSFYLSAFNQTQGQLLEESVQKFHKLMKEVGINVPKSLIRLSILAIDRNENNVTHNPAEIEQSINDDYDAHSTLIGERKYLEKAFFSDLATLMERALEMKHDRFAKMLDFSNNNDELVGRFNSILGGAAHYIIKYDPTERQSTIRNAEGKPIYRYVKYTPSLITAQSLRSKGLVETLSQDPYWDRQLKKFMEDNPAMGDLVKGNDTMSAKQMKLFMKNFKIALYGGVKQRFNKSYRPGKTFKNIDEQSLYILHLTSFLNRTVHRTKMKDADGKDVDVSIETYMRSFSQLEASQTNFLMTAVYEKYADQKGLVYNKDGRLKIVETLEGTVRQEYNRIMRELQSFETNKSLYAQGINNFILKENAEKAEDGTIRQTDAKGNMLRAYRFNKLADFFKSQPDLYTALLTEAQSNTAFEEIPADLKTFLLDALNDYALDGLRRHVRRLIKVGALKRVKRSGNKKVAVIDPATGLPKKNQDGEIEYNYVKDAKMEFDVFTSPLIASQLKLNDQKPVSIDDMYMRAGKGLLNEVGKPLLGEPDLLGLVQDAYFNHFANSLLFNDLLDGDVAMNVKDATDYFKRHKKQLAAGSRMKKGTHRVAYVDTIKGYIHDDYLEYGPFYSNAELEEFLAQNDTLSEEDKNKLKDGWGNKDYMRDMFDGQSVSTVMHQIDMYESLGRLSPEILDTLIAYQYRELTQDEVKLMQNGKVVNNPKKTVTADRNVYHKQSENIIARSDASMLRIPEEIQSIENEYARKKAIREYRKEKYDELHNLYLQVYTLRKQYQAAKLAGEDANSIAGEIQNTVEQIHSYFVPVRKTLHDLLNAMEYHQIDQLMDTTASKNATLLPVDVFEESAKLTDKTYINLALSAIDVDNRFKFLQVETSGVKDVAKFSVQSKALIAADLINLAEIASKSGKGLTASERTAIEQIAGALTNYQETLKAIGESNLVNLKTILRKGGDFDIGKVFNMIRESLAEQNAPAATLKLFEVGSDGKPVHSPNLPGLRNMLEYYFFAQYSKHITDEKGAGFKSIHISSVGYDIRVDENNKPIFTDDYKADPGTYKNVRTRPLGIEKVPNADGTTTYYVECIIPKPFFRSEAHREFFMKNLTKMFAVRIPTEDKRSMVALKVVDFMDSSNLNGIVVPHLVHLLAGSDFDVDSLYGQIYAHYFNASGTPSVYGDYSAYDSEEKGKFVEFVNYMSNDSDMKVAIKNTANQIKAEKSFTPSEDTLNLLYMSGFDESDYQNIINLASITEEYEMTSNGLIEARGERKEEKKAYLEALQREQENPFDEEIRAERRRLGRLIGELKDEIDELKEEKGIYREQISRAKRFAMAALQAEATLRTFEKYGLPVNIENFKANPAYAQSVRPIFQNQNLTAKLNILTNEAVFKYLYINERSSTTRFEQALKRFGTEIDDYESEYNQYTIDGIIHTKVTTSMNKDGIGISANNNKFLALASQYGLTLKDDNVIWAYTAIQENEKGDKVLSPKKFNRFGGMNEDKTPTRVIALIGNILGMFADGAKKPIPAALYMNEVNAGVTLAMIGVGLEPEFALGFNFMKEVRNAALTVQSSKSALSETNTNSALFLNNVVRDEISAIANQNQEAFAHLKELNVIEPTSMGYNLKLKRENIAIEFKAQPLDLEKLKANELTTREIGYSVSAIIHPGKVHPVSKEVVTETTLISLTEEEQKMILLQMYKEQAQQSFAIGRAASLMNLFKKLNPSFVTFDRLMKNLETIKQDTDDNIFTEESSAKIFADNQVWTSLYNAMKDLDEQASKLFLERTEFFRPIKNLFEGVFTNHAEIAKIITSYMSIMKYQNTKPDTSNDNELMKQLKEEDYNNMKAIFSPEHPFVNTLDVELEEMQKKYPDNAFLQLLRSETTDNIAYTDTKVPVPEKIIKMIGKSKASGELANEVSDAAEYLMYKENMFMKKLFNHEIVKSGMMYKAGSYMQFLNPDLLLPMSRNINEFVATLEKSKGNRYELLKAIQSFIGDNATPEQVSEMFNNLFILMGYMASTEVGNIKLKSADKVKFKPETLFMGSFQWKDEKSNHERKQVALKVIEHFMGQSIKGNPEEYSFKDVNPDRTPIESFIVNMNKPKDIPQATQTTMSELGKKLKVTSAGVPGLYRFPIMININKSTYLLQGIDSQIENANFGETMVKSIVGSGEYLAVGTTAKYAKIPSELSSGTISPLALSPQASEKYMAYVKNKATLKSTAVPKKEEVKVKTPKPDVIDEMAGAEDATSMLDAMLAEQPVKLVTEQGQYVKFNGETFIVVKENANRTVQIYNPTLSGAAAKKSVSPLNLTPVAGKANVVTYKGKDYLVTPKNTIISMTTNKAMQWDENNGDRKAVVALADEARKVDMDLNNLNMTPAVIDYLYKTSSKRYTKEKYGEAVIELVANLRATSTPEQIIEKIKCL